MERQFQAVPFLIFVYIAQLFAIFIHSLLFFNNNDRYTYEEKLLQYFLMGVFYLFYFNNLIKFVKSFYNIMQTSKIDDSDLVQIEVYITVALGAIMMIYGGIYTYLEYGVKMPKIGKKPAPMNGKLWCGVTDVFIGTLLWLQSYLTNKFYVVAQANSKNE